MKRKQISLKIPLNFLRDIKKIVKTFHENNYEVYIVGGSVRDLILGHEVYDYDFATNAKPDDVVKMFHKVIPTGIKHGTVTILSDKNSFEVTTYRCDGKYFDGRRPDDVSFSDTLEEDVIRRDFTINGLAYDIETEEVIDYVNGLEDLEKKVIRTIGSPLDRFNEDGLRPYRACRFASKLNFTIENNTFEAIKQTLEISEKVSIERVRDEIIKLLQSPKPSYGLEYLRRSGLMKMVLPELYDCYGVKQNKYHSYDVYHHCVYSCDAAPADNLIVRLSSLFHDIGKVPTRATGADGDYTFYNHEIVGSGMTRKLMKRLKFSNDEVYKTIHLVKNHMFHYTDEWSDGAVRRFMRKVGVDNLKELFELRRADRSGNGQRGGLPVPIMKLVERIEVIIEAENAISVKDLHIDGHLIMKEFQVKPGPIIGKILHELLELVLDEPELNEADTLLEKAREIYPTLMEEL